jgi:lipopolysaccharide transport system ATP-binding protein
MINENIAIRVEGVSKKFCRDLKRSMFYGTVDVLRNMLGISYRFDKLRKSEFWALEEIHFEIKKGETFGLIGANGSGKSTLLRLINGIFPPDKGRILVNGRIGALIAVGAGFHPHMTGRENIYLNGTILGMKRAEIKKKFDAIVDFAEIGDFLDAPVSTYSSGMHVRLGFAIAIFCEPEIMLVDEVLAVGDAKFQRKCLNKIRDLRNSGVTFILVSHNMQNIEGICINTLLLHYGKQILLGAPRDVIPQYELLLKTGKIMVHAISEEKPKSELFELQNVKKYEGFGTDEIIVKSIRLIDRHGKAKPTLNSDEPCTIQVEVHSSIMEKEIKLWLSFIYINNYDNDLENIVCLGARKTINLDQGNSVISIHFTALQLTTGEYKMAFHLFDKTFTNPYSQGHYGYFAVQKEIPTLLRVGTSTPVCWAEPDLEVIHIGE